MSSKIFKKLNSIDLLRDTVTIFVVIYHHISHYLQDYLLQLDDRLLTIVKHVYTSVYFFHCEWILYCNENFTKN